MILIPSSQKAEDLDFLGLIDRSYVDKIFSYLTAFFVELSSLAIGLTISLARSRANFIGGNIPRSRLL